MSSQIEFGDFQTPQRLADRVCEKLRQEGIDPSLVIEPTCGLGNFISAAQYAFSDVQECLGTEIDRGYVEKARERFADSSVVKIAECDVIREPLFPNRELPKNCLILGNPLWTTNSQMGRINGANLPEKSNIHGLQGMDALTGRSNFDISEWMLIRFTELLIGTDGCLAMLVKTSVARKVVDRLFKNGASIRRASIYKIDAAKEFNVSVDACLLVICFSERGRETIAECEIYDHLEQEVSVKILGWRRGKLVSDPCTFDRLADKYLALAKPENPWRSGIKHDCSKVFELKNWGVELVNGYGEVVDVEDQCLFPMMKSTDLARGKDVSRWIICSQKTVGEDTEKLKNNAPRLWEYLETHSDELDRRSSKIYSNKPRFSIFGVGPYSFQPWKIAISGLHKSYDFRLIGPYDGKPVLFDDTCYQVSFDNRQEAERVYSKITEKICIKFLNSFTFWDNKRPITAGILNQLQIDECSRASLGLSAV